MVRAFSKPCDALSLSINAGLERLVHISGMHIVTYTAPRNGARVSLEPPPIRPLRDYLEEEFQQLWDG